MAPLSVLPRVFSMGKLPLTGLVTHALAKLPNQPEIPQVVSLLRSETELRQFLNNNSTLSLKQYASNRLFNISEVQLMSSCRPPIYGDGSLAEISDLILGLNHHQDITELLKYRKCLTPESNVLLLNPNRPAVLALMERVWNDPSERPNIYQCLSDFRVWKSGDFEYSVLDKGLLKIAKIPRFSKDEDAYLYDLAANIDEEGDLVRMVKEAKSLNWSFLTYQDFTLQQAEYMIVKTCIGSLSSLFDCSNGELLKLKDLSRILLKHIDECISIILKADPMLNLVPYARVTLNRDRILDVIVQLLHRTRSESSLLRKTVNLYSNKELEATTGFFAKMAIRNETPGSYNVMINQLLRAKHSLRELRGYNEKNSNQRIELEL